MGWLDWLFKTTTPQKDEQFNHWEWLYYFLSSSRTMIPKDWPMDEAMQTKIFAFELGAMQGMAEIYGFRFRDVFNGYGMVIAKVNNAKNSNPIEDDEALSRLASTICEDTNGSRYMTEGNSTIKRAVLEKDAQAVGHLFSLVLEDHEF
ncbi:MAG: hypothetical protein AB7T38_10410 [Nitrospirales bacterium]